MNSVSQIIKFWFIDCGESKWFSSTKENDAFICKHVKHFFESKIPFFIQNDTDTNLLNVARVLVYDQFTRHYYRNQRIPIHYSSKAYQIAKNELYKYNNYTPEHYCFLMLPIRHNGTITELWKLKDHFLYLIEQNNNSMYIRFLKATIQKIGNRLNHVFLNPVQQNVHFINREILDLQYHHILDPVVYNTSSLSPGIKMYVSLSGGVDSMVCLHLLKTMNFDVSAIHINYTNRGDECMKEELFLKWYCYVLGVPLYIRKITEINRDREFLRSFYESYTRNVRFEFYKSIIRRYGKGMVVLGHNLDDSRENILTNIHQMKNLEYLSCMKAVSFIQGVNVFRPLLSMSKCSIIEYALNNRIPFLRDSTPEWSRRGMIRDLLQSPIQKVIPNFWSGMSMIERELSCVSTMYKNLADKLIITKEGNEYTISNFQFIDSELYIRVILQKLKKDIPFYYHSRTIPNIMDVMRSKRNIKIQLNKNSYMKYLQDNIIIYIIEL